MKLYLCIFVFLFSLLVKANTPPPISLLQLYGGPNNGLCNINTGGVISALACTGHPGYVATWNAGGFFDCEAPAATGITSLNGLIATTQTFATGTSGSDFNISSSVSTHTFNIPTASSSNRGLLSSSDWSTFNGKQTSGNYITALTSDVSATGPGSAAATVNSVGGSSAANIHSAELGANAATSANTASTIVKRDASGNFSAGTITAALSGNATTATTATNFSGSLTGDVTGTQNATVVSTVGGSSATNVHTAELAANAATNANTASTIVKRDSSGNFSAGTITAALSGNASTATTATNFSGSLTGDVTGTQGVTVVASVGGSSAANVHSAELAANGASSNDTSGNTLVKRASGAFTMGALTLGTATPTLNFTGGSAKLGTTDSNQLDFNINSSPIFSLFPGQQMMFNSDPTFWDNIFFTFIPPYGVGQHIVDDVASTAPGLESIYGNVLYYEITSSSQNLFQSRNANAAFLDFNPSTPQTYAGLYAGNNLVVDIEPNATLTGTALGGFFAAINLGTVSRVIGGNFTSKNFGGIVDLSTAGSFDSAEATGIDSNPHEAYGLLIGDTFLGNGITASGSTDSNIAAGILIRDTITATDTAAAAYAIKSDSTAQSVFAGSVATPTLILNSVSFSNAPSAFWSFATGSLTSISANQIVGNGKTARAMTVENITGAATTFTCVANPVLTLLDCGTSTGACTSGTTTIGSVTLTAANSVTAGSISNANIAAGHYFAWEITSGTCTVLNATGSAEAAMQ